VLLQRNEFRGLPYARVQNSGAIKRPDLVRGDPDRCCINAVQPIHKTGILFCIHPAKKLERDMPALSGRPAQIWERRRLADASDGLIDFRRRLFW